MADHESSVLPFDETLRPRFLEARRQRLREIDRERLERVAFEALCERDELAQIKDWVRKEGLYAHPMASQEPPEILMRPRAGT